MTTPVLAPAEAATPREQQRPAYGAVAAAFLFAAVSLYWAVPRG